ncbi:MAG TPA: serine/threonine-protein kinase [Kofleriaceae bacterium]|nr:serine/threonine-protein kinase [Kofleriaceae bacterium]
MKRPATIERASTVGQRAASLAETSPYRRTTASSITAETEPDEFGPYLVYEKLGEGGMACVHRAEYVGSTGLRKQVALKRLHTDASEDPSLVDAFVHEAQLAAKLHHPNIAQAYELGKIEDTYFIAMELVPGPTLLQIMNQSRSAGAVPLPIALELLVQIADALDHVHDLRDDAGNSLQLIHRDVTPANIIISRTGQAKLIDFGIAKARSARHATQAGYIKGKHGYVAPEYTYGQLDYRADLFALGVVAHELLTGRRLFSTDSELDTLRNVRHMAIPPPSRFRAGISPELDKIVLTALDRDPDKRWQSASAIRDAIVEETRRLKVAISGPQIRDWVEWAFHQNARKDSSVERMLRGLSPSMSIEIAEIEVVRPSAPTVVVDPGTAADPPKPLHADDEDDNNADDEHVTVDARATTPYPLVDEPLSRDHLSDEPPTIDMSPSPSRPASPRRIERAASEVAFLPAVTMDSLLAKRAPTPAAAIAARAGTPAFVAKPVAAPARKAPAKRRAAHPARGPHWRAPTRWMKPQARRSKVPAMILLALIAAAVLLVDQGLIDVDRWRQILGA